MKKKTKKIPFLLTQPLRSERQYLFSKIGVVLYLITLVAFIILGTLYWKSLRWYFKIPIALILGGLTLPYYEDIKLLITPYNKYKEAWEKHNAIKQ